MAKIRKKVFIEQEHNKILKRLCKEDMTESAIIREALGKYLMTKANLKKLDKKTLLRYRIRKAEEVEKLMKGLHKVATQPFRAYKYIRTHLYKYTSPEEAIEWVDTWIQHSKDTKNKRAEQHFRNLKRDIKKPKVFQYMKDMSYQNDTTFQEYERKFNERDTRRAGFKEGWKRKAEDA